MLLHSTIRSVSLYVRYTYVTCTLQIHFCIYVVEQACVCAIFGSPIKTIAPFAHIVQVLANVWRYSRSMLRLPFLFRLHTDRHTPFP